MNYKDIAIKVITGQASQEEAGLLKEWIGKSELNRLYYDDLKHVWKFSSIVQDSDQFDSEKAWQKAWQKLHVSSDSTNTKGYRTHLTRIFRIAAVILLTFLLGGISTYVGIRKSIKPMIQAKVNMNEIVSPKGAKSQVILPDGTIAWLNAGSKLRYSQTYNNDDRDVFLEGEAYFKVMKNPLKPFIVRTKTMSVKALGTAFNVKAYPEENTITTTLEEGKVEIEGYDSNSKKFEVTLLPNQKLTYTKRTTQYAVSSTDEIKTEKSAMPRELSKVKNIPPISIDNGINTLLYTSWKDDRWIIEREELGSLVTLLERRYNVTFICKSKALKAITFSGTIRKETLEQVLDILKLTAPVKYDIKEGTIILDLDNTRSDSYLKVIN